MLRRKPTTVMQDKQGHKESRDKYSLRGKVFESIREDILSGRYEQNTELKETAIGAEPCMACMEYSNLCVSMDAFMMKTRVSAEGQCV